MGELISSMPQSKPKNKLLRRVLPLILAILLLLGTYYLASSENSPIIFITEKTGSPLLALIIICGTHYVGVTIVAIGLLLEAWKPSLNFSLNKKKSLFFASIILFSIFVSINIWWWAVHGLPHWVPERGWQAAFVEYFLGCFANDTSILSLLFGTLFLTKSTPQKSSSYKVMLIGALIHTSLLFILYTGSALGPKAQDPRMVNFWSYTIFQLWFWFDFISEIGIFIGAVWLLIRANLKKLIFIIFLIVFLLLVPLIRAIEVI